MIKNILLVLTTAIAFSCSNNSEKSDAFGNFEADPVIVSAESSGKILQLNVDLGETIENGSVTAIIDTVQTVLKLQQTEAQKAAVLAKRQSIRAQIAVFNEQIKTLTTNRQRIERMLKDGASTQKQLDDVTGQINVLERQIESTRTQFTTIEKELQVLNTQQAAIHDLLNRCTITAPVDGTILETYVEQGELATPGKPLFKIADLRRLSLKVYVSGAQLPSIKTGQKVRVLIDKSARENQTLTGIVTWISSEAEFTPKIIQTKKERVKLVYAVKVSVENDGTLKIGMPGEIVF